MFFHNDLPSWLSGLIHWLSCSAGLAGQLASVVLTHAAGMWSQVSACYEIKFLGR